MLNAIILTLIPLTLFSYTPRVGSGEESKKPQGVEVDGKLYSESEYGPFARWECTDYICDDEVLLKVGFSKNPAHPSFGFVLFSGGEFGELAKYRRHGLEHHWEWGPKGDDYVFIIKADGRGEYYDFSEDDSNPLKKTPRNLRIPKSSFKCYRI